MGGPLRPLSCRQIIAMTFFLPIVIPPLTRKDHLWATWFYGILVLFCMYSFLLFLAFESICLLPTFQHMLRIAFAGNKQEEYFVNQVNAKGCCRDHSKRDFFPLIQLARYYEVCEQQSKEVSVLTKIATIYGNPPPSTFGALYGRMGEIHYALGNYEAALENFSTQLLLTRQLLLSQTIGRRDYAKERACLQMVGKTQLKLEKLHDALKSFQDAAMNIERERGYGKDVEAATSLLLAGLTCIKLGNVNEAENYFRLAIEIVCSFSLCPRVRVAADLYKNLGDLLCQKNKMEEGKECYQNAMDVHLRMGMADDSPEVAEITDKLSSCEDMSVIV